MKSNYLEVVSMTETMLKGIDACLDKKVFIPATTLIFAYIDTLGKFLCNTDTRRTEFGEFIQRYMPKLLSSIRKETGKDEEKARDFLYERFRNGFVHQYLSKAGTGIYRGKKYVDIKKGGEEGGEVLINPRYLRKEFAQALEKFKNDVTKDTNGIGENYKNWVEHIKSEQRELFARITDEIKVSDENPEVSKSNSDDRVSAV